MPAWTSRRHTKGCVGSSITRCWLCSARSEAVEQRYGDMGARLGSALFALNRPGPLPTTHREFDIALLSCRQHMEQQTRWAGDRFSLARDDAVAALQSSGNQG